MKILEVIESNLAPLYHWMTADKALNVFKQDKMPSHWAHSIPNLGDLEGNSFTRNPRFNYDRFRFIQIKIDQERLRQTNRIIPLDAERILRRNLSFDSDRSKRRESTKMAEEFVIGDILHLHRIIDHISLLNDPTISDEKMTRVAEIITEYCQRYDIPVSTSSGLEYRIEKAKKGMVDPSLVS